MEVAVISVTKQGDLIADKIGANLNVKLFSKYRNEAFNLKIVTEEAMKNYKCVIFISSTGIAVRSIAPFIKSKVQDPAVVVIDCTGKFVVSLLSGHLGGANELTLKISEIVNAQPIITTASDNLGFDAPDMIAKANDLVITDFHKAKEIAALLVHKKKVAFIDEDDGIQCPKGYCEDVNKAEGIVYVTNKSHVPMQNKLTALKLIRQNIVIGIGCKKNYPKGKMLNKVKEAFSNYNLDIRAIRTISTVEVKKKETAILELSKTLNVPLEIWTIDEIRTVEHKYKGSDFVKKAIGVSSVSEPSVELSGGEIMANKLSMDGMTLCIGYYKGDHRL